MKSIRILLLSVFAAFVVTSPGCKDDQDTDMPYIFLDGDNPDYLDSIGEVFIEPGFSAVDDIDGDLTSKVIVTYPVIQTDSAKQYEATYTVSDLSGNTFSTRRVIMVRNTAFYLEGFYGTCSQLCDTTADTLFSASVVSSSIVNNQVYIKNFGNLGSGIDVEATVNAQTGKIIINTPQMLPDSSTLDSVDPDSTYFSVINDTLRFQVFYTHSKNGGPPQSCRTLYRK